VVKHTDLLQLHFNLPSLHPQLSPYESSKQPRRQKENTTELGKESERDRETEREALLSSDHPRKTVGATENPFVG
jgi:hypothetical protein